MSLDPANETAFCDHVPRIFSRQFFAFNVCLLLERCLSPSHIELVEVLRWRGGISGLAEDIFGTGNRLI
ncbi:Agglutinin-like protein [Fusarium oxysporum f. sp. albedinis]|nr:Agglutinin-like protein [Fusarium oxysporum f. sp. albedinis]